MEKERTSDTLVSRNAIPIIDLSLGLVEEPSESWMKDTAKQINDALTTCGLAFLVNHGVSEKKITSVNKLFDTFYALPDDIKYKYKVKPPENPQGYVPPGMESLEKKEVRYCYNVQNVSGILPIEVPNFKEIVEDVVDDFLNLSVLILKLLAVALDLDPTIFLNFHKFMMNGDNRTTFREHYYPPIGEELVSNITRCGEHIDWGTFTVLIEDVEGGYQVFDGKQWDTVGHLPGAVLLNLGDLMRIWSSSQVKGIKHRVVVPEDIELRTKGRHSVAFFVHPDDRTPVDPSFFRHCRTGEELEKGKCMNALEYVHKKLRELFSQKK